MFNLPNFGKSFDYENNFYLTCDNSRIAKLLAHYELYNLAKKLTGEIVLCGIFKGIALGIILYVKSKHDSRKNKQ